MNASDVRQSVTKLALVGFSRLRAAELRAWRMAAAVAVGCGMTGLSTSDRADLHVAAMSPPDSVKPVRPKGPLDAFAPVNLASVNVIESNFALFETQRPARTSSAFDESFAAVAAASLDSAAMFGRAAEPAGVALPEPAEVTRLGAAAFALPRSKPILPAKVEVASIDPSAGASTLAPARPFDPALADGLPRVYPKGSAPYLSIIAREAKANGLPLWIPLGVIWVESKYDPKLRGQHTVMGMMQVMPSTAREMGYKGTAEQLLDAETNIVWGMKELGKDYKLANGDLCMTIAKYTGGFMTSRVRPAAQKYCNEVRRVTGMG